MPVGCANIAHDATRAKTEGALAGGGAGAVLGLLVAKIFGKNTAATLISVGIGSLLGVTLGYAVGSHVADKKAEYASREDWLDACIAEARKNNQEVANYNKVLEHEIKILEDKSTKLAADYKRQTAKRETLVAENKDVQKLRAKLDADIQALEERAVKEKGVVQDARAAKDNAEADILDAELKTLETQIAKMKEHNQKLANISVRMAV